MNRLYFQTPEYVASYDYDDQTLKLVGYHVDTDIDLGIELRRSDDSLIATRTFSAGTYDVTLPANQQEAVILTPQGKVSNIYARTF